MVGIFDGFTAFDGSIQRCRLRSFVRGRPGFSRRTSANGDGYVEHGFTSAWESPHAAEFRSVCGWSGIPAMW